MVDGDQEYVTILHGVQGSDHSRHRAETGAPIIRDGMEPVEGLVPADDEDLETGVAEAARQHG